MSTSHSHPRNSANRRRRIQQVACEIFARRTERAAPADDETLAKHQDLLPELARLQRIGSAIEQADGERVRHAVQRLRDDWARDLETDEGTSAFTEPPHGELSTKKIQSSRDTWADGGAQIGRYQIERLLGQGGFGSVYRAWDDQLARHVAIKVPHPQRFSDPADVEEYLNEARVLGGMDHAAIVPVFDAGRTADGRCFLVSKLIDGTDLATRIQSSRVPPDSAARIVQRIALALEYAHQCGIVHRDIKPANILLDAGGTPFLTDFGLARKRTHAAHRSSRAGTPAYMSPEQARGDADRIDGRSDVFSLGIVLYELLTGCKPFAGPGYDELLHEVLWSEPPPPSDLDLTLDHELDRISLKALRKHPGDRYATAQELADDLDCFLQRHPREDRVPSSHDWLSVQPREATASRNELRLAERASMWSAKPERRQLPSLSEWIAIRLFTRAGSWTSAQRTMTRVAARQHVQTCGGLCLLALVFLFMGTELTAGAKSVMLHFRAQTAMVWVALGQDSAIWPMLKHEPDPSIRTALIHRISPLVVDPKKLVSKLGDYRDVTVRRGMLLLIGELAGDPGQQMRTAITLRNTQPRQEHIRKLIELYRDDPDAGTHAAAEWTLRRYERDVELDRVRHRQIVTGMQGDRQWIETRHGHTMVIIPGLVQFMMGSPAHERDRDENESLHSRRIRAHYAVASKETTVAQFERFLRDNPGMRSSSDYLGGSSRQLPQTGVSWYQAAAYCNWLSGFEGLETSEWCYEPNAAGEYAAGMKIKEDTSLLGYRLPTEAEWEYACRAHAVTARYFGRADRHLDEYGIFAARDSADVPNPVGLRKPNDFGLFDMLGNVSEWCQDGYGADAAVTKTDDISGQVRANRSRVLRGGSFRDRAADLRCAARWGSGPATEDASIGFRVARNYEP